MPFAETAEEMLADWDLGKIVHTIEMGGLGPGYEQAIQILAIEFCRDFQLIEDWNEISEEELKSRRDAVYDRYFRGEGYSGAQVGAAMNLAVMFCRHGPRAAAEQIGDTDRHTMVSKNFPKAPDHTPKEAA